MGLPGFRIQEAGGEAVLIIKTVALEVQDMPPFVTTTAPNFRAHIEECAFSYGPFYTQKMSIRPKKTFAILIELTERVLTFYDSTYDDHGWQNGDDGR